MDGNVKMKPKMNILFLTGTRADYGKIKVSLPPSAMFGSIGTADRFMEMLNNFDSSELGVQKYFINLKD